MPLEKPRRALFDRPPSSADAATAAAHATALTQRVGVAALNIRRFRTGDAHALFEIFHSAVHLVACADYTPEQIDAWAPSTLDQCLWAQRLPALSPFVAELNGRPVGYADLQLSGYIDHFFVSGHHARTGIGTRLMAALHVEAKRLQLDQLTSDVSLTAELFFAQAGFTLVARREVVLRGVPILNARMRKALH